MFAPERKRVRGSYNQVTGPVCYTFDRETVDDDKGYHNTMEGYLSYWITRVSSVVIGFGTLTDVAQGNCTAPTVLDAKTWDIPAQW